MDWCFRQLEVFDFTAGSGNSVAAVLDRIRITDVAPLAFFPSKRK
jgi:hypothetical protein